MIPISIGLSAVIFGLRTGLLQVLCIDRANAAPALPSGPFDPQGHRTFELGLRDFIAAQTGFKTGYVEQLYTFGDLGREAGSVRDISVGYMALTATPDVPDTVGAQWTPVAHFFPWAYTDDSAALIRDLRQWATTEVRRRRVAEIFHTTNDRVLDRYELLYEAGLVTEAGGVSLSTGAAMASDHRRILATALSRLRAKIAYRPVIYELMPREFTLSDLQTAIEAITGVRLHKQNFRRGVLATGHIVATGDMRTTSGRPAALYRVDPAGILANPGVGLTIPVNKSLSS